MDSNTLTHVAAILVGVVVTLALVGGFSSKKAAPEAASRGVSVAENTAGDTQTKKKKKKKKKKSKGGGDGGGASPQEETPAVTEDEEEEEAAPAPKEEEPVKEEEAAPAEETTTKKKKKKKKKKAAAAGNNGATNGATAPANTNNNAKENQPKAANAPSPAPKIQEAQPMWQQPPPMEEEWNDVKVSKKKKQNRPKPAKPAAATPNANIPTPTESVIVDAKKIGIIIGPKGATMQALQEATGCQLDINAPAKDDKKAAPKATVVLTGDKEAMAKAKKAINELASKGYARILQSDGFGEFSITVHPRYLSDIVGPGGKNIKALQSTLDVKITIPSTDWKPNQVQVGQVKPAKVGIAGSKDSSKRCKQAIQSLIDYHHHDITHPGMVHEEVYVPSEFFHCVIGPRGSEIRHIKGNYKVDVFMPNSDSITENVMVVGKQANVDKAISYIQLLMDRDTEQREKKYSDEYYG